MRTVEADRVRAVAGSISETVLREFGTGIYTPSVITEQSGAQIYAGMAPYPANPDILVVPTGQNMQALSQRPGSVFGVMVGKQVRPAVVTPRSTAQRLDLTYLTPPTALVGTTGDFDQINPRSPAIDPLWPMLLKQAAAVQDRRVGENHDVRQSAGRELGHVVLSTAALKKPTLLSGGHAVHGWTAGQNGIAGAATDRSIGLYDFKLRDGVRSVEEATITIDAEDTCFLLKVPELDSAMYNFADVSAANLTAGIGLVAVQTQLEVSSNVLSKGLLANMGRL